MIPLGYKPRFGLFHIIAVIGISLAGYYGYELMTWPEFSEADLEESVEINLAIDLSRRGAHLLPDEAGMERLREQIRAEITGARELAHERLERRFGVGLLLSVVGGLRLLTHRGA